MREGQAGSLGTAAQVADCTTQEGATHMLHSALPRTQSAKSIPGPGVGDEVREVLGSPTG